MTDKNNKIDDKVVRGYGEQALRDEAQAILDQIPYLDDNFEKAVDMMYHSLNGYACFLYQSAGCISWRPRCDDRQGCGAGTEQQRSDR